MEKNWREILNPYFGPENLNIGCGRSPEVSVEGQRWVNLDMDPDGPADVIHDMNVLPLPFESDRFDSILAVHVLEHIEQAHLIDVVYDFARILKVGGHLIAIVPHGNHPDAWHNPHHRQRFDPTTWAYFDNRIYDVPDNVGTGARQNHKFATWTQQMISMTPDDRYLHLLPEEIEKLMVDRVGIIKEMQAVLRLDAR